MQGCADATLQIEVVEGRYWWGGELWRDEAVGVRFETRYGVIPVELRRLIASEPEDAVRAGMLRATEQVVIEALIEDQLSGAAEGADRALDSLIALRCDLVAWDQTSRVHLLPTDLRRKFQDLCSAIEYRAAPATAIENQTPELRLKSLLSNRHRAAFRAPSEETCVQLALTLPAHAAQEPTIEIHNVDYVPVVVVFSYLEGPAPEPDSSSSALRGVTILKTSQLADRTCEPLKTLWKAVHAPLRYEVLDGRDKHRFNSFWKLYHYLLLRASTGSLALQEDAPDAAVLPSTEMVLKKILSSLKNDGDSVLLHPQSGVKVSCKHSDLWAVSGELCFRSLFTRDIAQAANAGDMLRTVPEYQAYLEGLPRVPYDAYGGAVLQSVYNPNLHAPICKMRHDFDDHDELRRYEKYEEFLNIDGLFRWKEFLCGSGEGGEANLVGGVEQWVQVETAFETAADNVPWNGNWLHTVNYNFASAAPDAERGPPRFLIEVWVGEEFGGELLLPQLHDLASEQRSLWRLCEDASVKGGVTRKDYRKQTAPTDVKGWIYLDVIWEISNPRRGLLTLSLRELRNISTKSIREDDRMRSAPQVKVWRFADKEWQECGAFPAFEHALYFLENNRAEETMAGLWSWDRKVLGPQPAWFNYFSWAKPGEMRAVTQEIAVPIIQAQTVQRVLALSSLTTRYEQPAAVLWDLCAAGVPTLMRPYVWTELSGARLLRKKLDQWVNRVFGGEARPGLAYGFITQNMLCTVTPWFACIDEDMDVFSASFGLESAHREMISRILKSLMLFCSPRSRDAEKENDAPFHVLELSPAADGSALVGRRKRGSTVNSAVLSPYADHTSSFLNIRYSALGASLMYSYRMVFVAYYLSLDFASQRLSEEDIFYLLLVLFSVDVAPSERGDGSSSSSSRASVVRAPFLAYYVCDSARCFDPAALQTPKVYHDSILLRILFEYYQPEQYAVCTRCGLSIEAAFTPILGSLFAGMLPTQSLYRLWDLIFNIIWKPTTLGQPIPATAWSVGPEHVKHRPRAHSEGGNTPEALLFDNSVGRFTLVAFAFKVMLEATAMVPPQASGGELRDAISRVCSRLRNPGDVVIYVEAGAAAVRAEDCAALRASWENELHARYEQLNNPVLAASLLEKALVNRSLLQADVPSNYVLAYDEDPAISRRDKVYGVPTQEAGLTTGHLIKSIYPASKYHCLYASGDIRQLPPGTQGRLVLHVGKIEFPAAPRGAPRGGIELMVSFQQELFRKVPQYVLDPSGGYKLTDQNIFIFYIENAPPYSLRIALKNLETGEVVSKQRVALEIKKLTTQGSPMSVLGPASFTGTPCKIYLRWTLFVPTRDMFMPEIDGRGGNTGSSWKPGCGFWGDVAPFDPYYVRTGADRFRPLNRPRCFIGLNRHLLESVLAFVFPPGVGISDKLVMLFGRVRDRNNLQALFGTAVSFREILTTLITLSSGSLTEKIELLFDLFGHHEPEKVDRCCSPEYIGTTALYYHAMVSPDTPSPIHYRQMTALERLSLVATRPNEFLPEGICPDVVRKDKRVINNVISMASIVDMVTQILTKSGVHMNTLDIIQYCCLTFDPMRRLPRVLVAALRATEPGPKPEIEQVSETGSPSLLNAFSCNTSRQPDPSSEGSESPTLHPYRECDGWVDVTLPVLEWVARSTAETQWWGLNFFTYQSLQSLGIDDPFPGMVKRMDIVITPSGDLGDATVVNVDIDENGAITGGRGGNYLTMVSQDVYDELRGSWAPVRPDLFLSGGSKGLMAACYAFELQSVVVDKYHFVMTMSSTSFVTDCLRRANVFAKPSGILTPLNVTCFMNVPFSTDFHRNVLGLSFRNQQPVSQICRVPLPNGTAEGKVTGVTDVGRAGARRHRDDTVLERDEKGRGQYLGDYTVSSDTGASLDREFHSSHTLAFEGEAVHGSVIKEGLQDMTARPQVVISIKCVRNLRLVQHNVCDLYGKVEYGSDVDCTATIRDVSPSSGLIEWTDSFLYYIVNNCTRLRFSIVDASEEKSIGETELDFNSLMTNQARFTAHLTLPLLWSGLEVGEIDITVAFVGVNQSLKTVQMGNQCVGELMTLETAEKHVHIKILCGTNLPLHCNPFCQLSSANDVVRTKTVEDCKGSAVWNDVFSFNVYRDQEIQLRVVDDDRSRDQVIGNGVLDLSQFTVAAGPSTHRMTIPMYDGLNNTGDIEVELTVDEGPLPSSDVFDWGAGNVRLVVDRACRLPSGVVPDGATLKSYVIIELEKQKEQTLISPSPNPLWQTAITYQCRSGSSNCIFTVCAHNEDEDIILGQAVLNMQEARQIIEKAATSIIKLPLDGLCRGTGGELWIDVQFVAYPRNLNRYQFIRVHVNSIRELARHALIGEHAKLLINLGSTEVTTSLSHVEASYDEISIPFKETFDLRYNKDEIVSFTLVDVDPDTGYEQEVCGCAYDLWAALRLNRESIRGDLWMKRQDQGLGKLRLQLTYLEGLPKPWPDACIVDLVTVKSNAWLSHMPHLTVSVRDATAYGNIVEGYDFESDDGSSSPSQVGISKRVNVGRTFGLKFCGQPSVWVDVAVSLTEVWSAEVPITPQALSRKYAEDEYTLSYWGREVGSVKLKMRFIERPVSVSSCTYIKVQLVELCKVVSHFGPGYPTTCYLTVDLDHKNTVQSEPVRVLSDSQPIACNWISPYRQQPIIRFTLRDAKGFALSTADLNVWEVMSEQERNHKQPTDRLMIQLNKARTNAFGGRVYVKIDFICHPKDLRFPKQVLVGFSHGVNIGGDLAYDQSRNIIVRIKSGETNALSPPKTKNNVWGNWTGVLDLEPNNQILTVEVFDKKNLEVLGSLLVHIWDIFRDPFLEWSGLFRIHQSKSHKSVGSLYISMRLLIPQRLTVNFGDVGTKCHPPLRYSKVFGTDTPKDIRRKFIAACREIANMKSSPLLSDEQRVKYRLAQLIPNSKTTHVDVQTGKKLLLPDKSSLVQLFPQLLQLSDESEAAAANLPPKVIDLAIVGVSNSPGEERTRRRQSEPYADCSIEESTDEDCSTFPMGESIQTKCVTLARDETPWVRLALDNTFKRNTRNIASKLVDKTFEFHPSSDAPLGSTGYANLPCAEVARILHTLRWPRSFFARPSVWVPVVIHAMTSVKFLISRISPIETIVGHDLPDYSHGLHVNKAAVLPVFSENDVDDKAKKSLMYRNRCAHSRTSKFKSVGISPPWTPHALPRTQSMAFAKKNTDIIFR